MFKWQIVGGYNGKFGTITAIKNIDMLFVPIEGLFLLLDNSTIEIKYNELIYDISKNIFNFIIPDYNDQTFSKEYHSIDEIKQFFEQNGWEIIDKY